MPKWKSVLPWHVSKSKVWRLRPPVRWMVLRWKESMWITSLKSSTWPVPLWERKYNMVLLLLPMLKDRGFTPLLTLENSLTSLPSLLQVSQRKSFRQLQGNVGHIRLFLTVTVLTRTSNSSSYLSWVIWLLRPAAAWISAQVTSLSPWEDSKMAVAIL